MVKIVHVFRVDRLDLLSGDELYGWAGQVKKEEATDIERWVQWNDEELQKKQRLERSKRRKKRGK